MSSSLEGSSEQLAGAQEASSDSQSKQAVRTGARCQPCPRGPRSGSAHRPVPRPPNLPPAPPPARPAACSQCLNFP